MAGRSPIRWRGLPQLIGAGVLLAARLAAAQVPAAGIDEYLGRPIADVRLTIEGRETREVELANVLETAVGQPLAMAQVRESLVRLMALSRFENVQVRASAAPAGVLLVYELVPLRTVREMAFRGSLGLSEGQVRAAVVDRFGASPPAGRAADIAAMLKNFYGEHGYLRAQVTPRAVEERRPEETRLVFDIDAGPRARLSGITVTVPPGMSQVQAIVGLGLRAGEEFDREVFERRVASYTEELRARGYFEARILWIPRYSADGQRVDLNVDVQRGPHVTLEFRGDPLPPDRREELVPIRREGSVDEDLLEDSRRNIEDYLRAQGYRDARAPFTREASATGNELTIVFDLTKGPQYRIGAVEIAGRQAIPEAELRPLLRVREGEPFVASKLEADKATIEGQYRRRGFASVKVSGGEVPQAGGATGQPRLAVRISIQEGPQTLVESVAIEGNRQIASQVLRPLVKSAPGQPFYEPQVAADREALLLEYANSGYQTATVDVDARRSADGTREDLRFLIHEGPRILVDHILIVGNTRTKTSTIERQLGFTRGSPLGLNQLTEAQQRLSALGLFRRVRVTPLQHGTETRRDVLVVVEEAPATTIGYGGGVEGGRRLRNEASALGQPVQPVEVFELAPRGFFEIGRRNLWGKNRSVNLFARVSVRPKDPTVADVLQGNTGGLGVSEYRTFGTFREPRVFGTGADLAGTAYAEQAIRSSFNFRRKGVTAEMAHRLSPILSVSGRYSFAGTQIFNDRIAPGDRLAIDRLFPQVRLSMVSSSVVRDTRDDALEPTRGSLTTVEGEVAARRIGSEVGLAKSFVQTFVYRRVPGLQNLVFAGAARLGLATGFPRTVPLTDANGNPIIGPDVQPVLGEVKDIPASERFFAGGDTTVRGFAQDRLGTPATLDRNGVGIGGNAELIFNGELRFPIWRSLGGVTFLDVGNVFGSVADVRLGDLRAGTGFGVRYRSPIGPIRFDVGFNLSRLQFPNLSRDPLVEFYIGIGQAF
jgi:outer membrane protein assembly factor BamA